METTKIIDLTPENIADYGVCGYKDMNKHAELRKKIAWFNEYYPKGLRIKALLSPKGSYQGMLEYIPGKYAHRPVDAAGYLFIHCLFVGFKKEFKGKGYASSLIDACIKEAMTNELLGVAVVTRKGSFMADNPIFLKNGFQIVDHAEPDFELLVFKFDEKSKNPGFKQNMGENLKHYDQGLTILRSAQCPYTEKNVNAIIESAKRMKLKTRLVDLADANAAQHTPCAFGTFSIIYNGKIISHHPISNTRFENIMKKEIHV
ncbi:MAG: YoaP domain-containing protein [Bacteroidetes bacterium]|jgi:ribosomal protein S18 acetylase RimI-like enzyme|nr:YoaP domain-containing protein [Bacteroidota bacterium]